MITVPPSPLRSPGRTARNVALETDHREFLCPISYDMMKEPVRTIDGQVYDRASIEDWFQRRRERGLPITSPATNLALESDLLAPDLVLHEKITKFQVKLLAENSKNNHITGGNHLPTEVSSGIAGGHVVLAKDTTKFTLSSELLQELDKIPSLLKDFATNNANFKVPQIIALGNNRHGKSSLLERIIGLPIFPKHSDDKEELCTRCVVRVQMRRGLACVTEISIVDLGSSGPNGPNDSHSSKERESKRDSSVGRKESSAEEFRKKNRSQPAVFQTQFGTLETIREQVYNAMQSLRTYYFARKEIIDDKEILVKIQVPYCIPLDLIDLPGLVKTNPQSNGAIRHSQNVPEVARKLAMDVISQSPREMTTILLVNDVNVSAKRSLGCEIVTALDYEDQTIGVFTKIDEFHPEVTTNKEKPKVREEIAEEESEDFTITRLRSFSREEIDVANELAEIVHCDNISAFPLSLGWMAVSCKPAQVVTPKAVNTAHSLLQAATPVITPHRKRSSSSSRSRNPTPSPSPARSGQAGGNSAPNKHLEELQALYAIDVEEDKLIRTKFATGGYRHALSDTIQHLGIQRVRQALQYQYEKCLAKEWIPDLIDRLESQSHACLLQITEMGLPFANNTKYLLPQSNSLRLDDLEDETVKEKFRKVTLDEMKEDIFERRLPRAIDKTHDWLHRTSLQSDAQLWQYVREYHVYIKYRHGVQGEITGPHQDAYSFYTERLDNDQRETDQQRENDTRSQPNSPSRSTTTFTTISSSYSGTRHARTHYRENYLFGHGNAMDKHVWANTIIASPLSVHEKMYAITQNVKKLLLRVYHTLQELTKKVCVQVIGYCVRADSDRYYIKKLTRFNLLIKHVQTVIQQLFTEKVEKMFIEWVEAFIEKIVKIDDDTEISRLFKLEYFNDEKGVWCCIHWKEVSKLHEYPHIMIHKWYRLITDTLQLIPSLIVITDEMVATETCERLRVHQLATLTHMASVQIALEIFRKEINSVNVSDSNFV